MKDRIYMIGYRCSGKTTVGRLLADTLNWSFLDLDDQFEIRAGTTIRDFWEENGEEAFRKLEKSLLSETLDIEYRVVATGGGIVEDEENRERLRNNGAVVWLRASPETLRERMKSDESNRVNRPALSGKSPSEEIEQVLKKRKPLYEEISTLSVETDSKCPEELVKEIREKLPIS